MKSEISHIERCTGFATLETRRELEPKCVPQLFLGWLREMRRSAIGHLFPLSLATISEVFAKVYSAQFPSRFLSGELSTMNQSELKVNVTRGKTHVTKSRITLAL